MVLVKSFFAAAKWTLALYLVLIILFMLGFDKISPLALSLVGFVVMFIVFLLENLELNY